MKPYCLHSGSPTTYLQTHPCYPESEQASAHPQSLAVVYDQPEQLEELKKVLRCYQMVPFWEKREADKWARLKVVIDGVESEAAWSIMAKDVPEFMKEDSQRALSFEVFEKE